MHCVENSSPLYGLEVGTEIKLAEKLEEYLAMTKRVYAALVDAGIPWEDARRYLPMGFQTYLHGIYDFLTVKGTLANRLEHIMDWEYNCVAQLMHREIYIAEPFLGKFLGSHSDWAQTAQFAGLQSWPPDGKWPSPYDVCAVCQKSKKDHDAYQAQVMIKGENGMPSEFPHEWFPTDPLERMHKSVQNPFWVLTKEALHGGPVEWIATNGTYPHDKMKGEK
jgi:hypothetical protein